MIVTSFVYRAALLGLVGLCLAGGAAAKGGEQSTPAGVYRGVLPVVKFDVSPPLRSIEPGRIPDGSPFGGLIVDPNGPAGLYGPQDVDPLVQDLTGLFDIPAPTVSFDGPSNLSGVSPPDPVGDVGPNHYVAMSNLYFQVYNKNGASLYGPAANNTLWSGFGGPCQTENSGDPIVLYDQLDDRWILTQFTASGPTYYNCVAVSTTSDPTGTYYRYAFSTGSNFPDYPKYGVWSDAIYISTREFAGSTFAGVGAYAVNRAQLVAGNPTPQVISFFVTPAAAGGAFNIGDGLLPSDLDGNTLPPAGSPNYFLGAMDNGATYGAPQDALTLWKFTASFANPPSSTFTLTNTIPIASYDTVPVFCSGRACVPQPGTSNRVDHLGYRQRPLHRLAYRNFGTHQSLVTNQSVEASATMSGIRWWEIRSPNSSPVVYQEGTYAPGLTDGIHRWMGSIAMDSAGNMALGYSASDGTSTYPSVRYSGRLATDPLGTLPQGEGSIINGTGSQTSSNRWGDYTSMNLDPVDDCTFWFVNQYLPVSSGNGWRLRIGAFKFAECGAPDFSLGASPLDRSICAGQTADFTVNVGSISGYAGAVTLSASGQPAGATATFGTNPVTPPGSSLLTIGATGAAVGGLYPIQVQGQAGPTTHTTSVNLSVFDGLPSAPALVSPADGALNQALRPAFQWTGSGAETYTLQVATDAAFANVVYSTTVGGTSATPGSDLASNTQHFWRVRGTNPCGDGSVSPVYSFYTVALPGDCGFGTQAVTRFFDDFESGALGWTHSGTGDTWSLNTVLYYSGATAWLAADPATVSDQRLVSPAIALPTGESPLTVQYWTWQDLENNGTTGCYDGGIVEISTDGGATWIQLPTAALLTDPYDGPVATTFSNPLAGLQAWCGQAAQGWVNSVVDVSAYAGATAQFRFRLGSDTSVSRQGWAVDAFEVQSCEHGPDRPLDHQDRRADRGRAGPARDLHHHGHQRRAADRGRGDRDRPLPGRAGRGELDLRRLWRRRLHSSRLGGHRRLGRSAGRRLGDLHRHRDRRRQRGGLPEQHRHRGPSGGLRRPDLGQQLGHRHRHRDPGGRLPRQLRQRRLLGPARQQHHLQYLGLERRAEPGVGRAGDQHLPARPERGGVDLHRVRRRELLLGRLGRHLRLRRPAGRAARSSISRWAPCRPARPAGCRT